MGQMTELQQQIINLCNQSNLPIECIVYVLKDCWRDAEATLRTMQANFPNATPPMGEENTDKEEK